MTEQKKENKKIVVCDLDGTVSDSRDRVEKYLYDGFVCNKCGKKYDLGFTGTDDCTVHEGFGIGCSGNIVKKEKNWDSFYHTVGKDNSMQSIIDILVALSQTKHKIMFVTGRSEVCRFQTEEWIQKKTAIRDYELIMRAEYDHRHAKKMKKGVIKNMLDAEDIAFVLDDDEGVLKMYKEYCPNATIIDVGNYMHE